MKTRTLADLVHPTDSYRRGAGDDRRISRPSVVSKFIYVSLIIAPVAVAVTLLLLRSGVIATSAQSPRTPWDASLLVLLLLATVAMGVVVVRRLPDLSTRAQSEAIDRAVAAWELRILSATTPLAIGINLVAFLAWADVLPLFRSGSDAMWPIVLAATGTITILVPAAVFDHLRTSRTRAIEKRFPDFLRDMNESQSAGMTMASAIKIASHGDYGRLRPEIVRMAHQVSWGTPFDQALRMFADRVRTPLVVRAVSLINKATRSGGSTRDVLAAATRDAREIASLADERRAGMALYVVVVYVAFGVFLAVVAALQGLLVPSLITATLGDVSGIGGVEFSARLRIDDFRFIYLAIGTVQAIGSGMVAGIMSEGDLDAGLKHAAVMLAMATLVLGVIL